MTKPKTEQATKRPWALKQHANGDINIITDAETMGVSVELAVMFGRHEEAQANARLIVRAVNNFDELLRLCKWTLKVLDSEKWDTSLQAELREAIIKAKEE